MNPPPPDLSLGFARRFRLAIPQLADQSTGSNRTCGVTGTIMTSVSPPSERDWWPQCAVLVSSTSSTLSPGRILEFSDGVGPRQRATILPEIHPFPESRQIVTTSVDKLLVFLVGDLVAINQEGVEWEDIPRLKPGDPDRVFAAWDSHHSRRRALRLEWYRERVEGWRG